MLTLPGPVLSGFDTSAMTEGQLAYISAPGFVRPADNLAGASRASNVVAVFSGGVLQAAGGPAVDVMFTTDGGKPAVGAPVYLGSADDDTSTGIGKATARKPQTGTPFPEYPQTIVQNCIFIGTCADNTNWDALKKCKINFMGGRPEPTTPLPRMNFVGYSAAPFSSTKNFSRDGNSANLSFHEGETIAILFTLDDSTAFSSSNWMLGNVNGGATRGWFLGCGGAGQFQVRLNNASVTELDLTVPRLGLNCAVATIKGGILYGCLNGVAFASTPVVGSIVDPSAGFTFTVGGLNGIAGWSPGSILGFAKMARGADQAEMVAWAGMVTPKPPAMRFLLPDAIRNDPALAWSWRALDWTIGTTPFTVGGPAGAGFTLATNPDIATGPQKVNKNEAWYRTLLPYMIDTEPGFYDSRGRQRTDGGARLVFTTDANAGMADMCIGVSCDDFDDVDQAQTTLFDNGAGSYVQPQANGELIYHWVPLSGTSALAAHDIQIVEGEKLDRGPGTAKTGTCLVDLVSSKDLIFLGPATSRRLVLVGDDDSMGHDNGTFLNCLTTLLRLDYPGRVTCHSGAARAISRIYATGGNSMVPYAHEIAEVAAEGNPTTKELWFALGMQDYLSNLCTLSVGVTRLAQLLDATHGLIPSGIFYVQNYIASYYDAIANSLGETLTQWNTALVTMTSTRPWAPLKDVRGPGSIPFNSVSHYRPTGPATIYKGNVKVAIGY